MQAGIGLRSALTVLTMVLLLGTIHAEQDEQLIGWLGETYQPKHRAPGQRNATGMQVLSWHPRVFHYRGFLSPDEAEHIVRWAEPRVRRSAVSNAATGEGLTSNVRTSSGVFIARKYDEVVTRIEERIARWTMLPADYGEDMNVLRYQLGQKYDSHHDYFSFKGRDDNGGNRMCTVLMYLSDVEEGGETVFPHVPPLPSQTAAGSGFTECAQKGLAVRPRKGDAIAFWSIKPSGAFDYKSLHGACPVVKGQKWSMTKWIHVGHFGGGKAVPRTIYEPSPPPVPPGCKDQDKSCEMWAESGECEVNPAYMVGTKDSPGRCLAACSRCDLMPQAQA